MLRFYIIADERRNGNGEMIKAVVQTKETWVDSKQKVLLANRFKCEFLLVILSSPFEILIIL